MSDQSESEPNAIFAARLLGNAPPLIFEDGEQSRDFTHVSDVASACIQALSLDEAKDVSLNIGTGKPTTIRQLAGLLQERLGGPEPEFLGNFRPGDIFPPNVRSTIVSWHNRM